MGVAQVVECLSLMHEALGSIPNTSETTHGGPHRNSSTGNMGAGGSETQGYPQFPREFEASLGYVGVCLKMKVWSAELKATPTLPEKLSVWCRLSLLTRERLCSPRVV